MTPRTTRIIATTIAATTAAASLFLLTAAPSSAVEEPPGSAILDPEDVDKLLDEPTAEVLELAIGLPADLADTGGELAQFSADVRPTNSDIRFTVLVDTAASLALSGTQLELEDEGWDVGGGLTTGQGFTASRDSDGDDDGNHDGFGEETLLVSVDEQPSGRVAVHYSYSPGAGVDLSSVTASAFFTAISEAHVDEAMAFESAALTVTLQPVTRSGGIGTSTIPPGVAFTGRYTTALPDAERLVGALDELCDRPGYTCTGDPLRSSPTSGSAFLRLPSGGSGTLSIGPVADEDIAVVQFFLSFNLDTGLVLTPGDATAVVPDPDAADADAGALPPKAGTDDDQTAAPAAPAVLLLKEPAGLAITPAVLAGGGAAFLAFGGLLAALFIRRRRRAAELPEVEAPAVIETALGELARAALAAGVGFRPRVVQIESNRTEVLLTDTPATLPDDWTATAELVWARSNLAPNVDLNRRLVPQLLDLETGDGTRLAIDLEAEPCLNVLGEPDDTLAFVTRLASDADAAGLDVYVITNDPDLAAAAGVPASTFESWDEPWSLLAARTATVAGILAEHEWPSVFAARAASPDHPALRPTLVITDSTLPAELVGLLGQTQWGTVAVISLADSPGGTPLFVTDTELHLPTLGLRVDRTPTVVASGEPPVAGAGSVSGEVPRAEDGGWERFEPTLAPGEVLLRLLGDIRVERLDQLTTKPTAVLAYIAVHPGATVGRVVDGCWPDTTMSSRRRQLGKIVTHLRTVLGKDLLPDAENGRYRTGPGVIADINVFDDLVASSRDAEPAEEARLLRCALDLVDGRPFTYSATAEDAYTWVDDENLVATWERSIRETATRCAEVLLELDRPDDAVAAITPVLAKVPGDTALTELLMTALAASGDRLSVQRVYQAHGRSLEKLNLVGAEESIDDLYQRLVGTNR
jgi:DNA-binding SARP family transcriptional activator